ncbi:phage tail tape measure protein [Burkholderia multivorans]|uniref:phage tail tape measure protein n=1 Tax=Burkholderia multivorans TaxID=87883 RepID=UPI000D003B48|nr:phage tail tape measure protein [Burkholderia multivorans]MBU9121826.1 phage tail tape measure protein [Burkholderia multivorans]PRF42479.1 tail tape measure protein [Burkholderia multivorans]PRG50765.1 tail tape measure protein [Burkholderia multivorans]
MSRDLDIGLNLRLRDQASAPASQAERNVQRGVRQTAQTYADASRVSVTTSRMLYDIRSQQSTRTEQAVQRNIQQTTAAYVQSNRTVLSASQRLAAARMQLDVRSEQTIRREIDQTIAAYNRLARAGFASTAEQARAFAALKNKVADLNRELHGVEQTEGRLTRAGRGISTAWKVGGAVAGVAGAAMVAAAPVRETMDYNRRLTMMANTAFSDRDVSGRRRGVGELDQAIRRAVAEGGGSPNQAADTLDNLLASGAVSDKTAMNLLPMLQKFSTATGADPNELGNIAIRAMQNFGIKEGEIPRALDMALKGGQAGGFELKDMSKWLPQQMALAKTAGMSGLQDFGRLVVANQAAVITAGTKDEAGNNLVNLLEKLNSADTQVKAKHLGINLTGSLAASRAQGVNALDAFVGIVERVMSRDANYRRTQAQLAKAPEGERKAILASQASLLEGTAIGKLIHDRQALGALVAYMNQRDYRKLVSAQVFDSKSAVEDNFAMIQATPSYKVEQASNAAFFGRQDALADLNQKIGNAATTLTDYASKYPGLMTAIEGTTLGLRTLTAAIAPLAVLAVLRGGAGAAGAAAAGGAAAAVPAGVVGAAAGAASFGARLSRIMRVGGPIGVAMQTIGSGFEAADIAADPTKTADQSKAGYVGVAGGAIGGLAGMAAGAAAGAAAGSVVPGAGTAVGLLAGGVAGYFGHDWGERLGKMIGDAIFAQKKDDKPPVVEGHFTINLEGQHLYDFVATANQKNALRN